MKTILYYTSNRENEEFEEKIRQNILENCGDLPIISISQKPIDFGKNICVGDVGHSYLNEWRQILIGAKKARTKHVILCEADFLYPKEYFEFEPGDEKIYRYNNVWIVFKNRILSYRRKIFSEGAQICDRKYLIKMLEEHLKDQPEWVDGKFYPLDKNGHRKLGLRKMPFSYFTGKIPCISFKTGDGVNKLTAVMRGREYRKLRLPHWGHVNDLRAKYL